MKINYIGARSRLLPILITDKGNIVGKESIMLSIPSAAQSLFMSFSTAFTRPTFQRNLPLAVGAILATGRRPRIKGRKLPCPQQVVVCQD